jgi:integrase/recombinase XerD
MQNGTVTAHMKNWNMAKNLIKYIPAQLHEGKRWYIDFYVEHPGSDKLVRKQIKVNRIKLIAERRKYAKRLVQEINIKLSNGWNPFIEQEAPKAFYRLSTATKSFLDDKRDKRPDTIRSYKNFLKLFQEWILEKYRDDIYVINVNSSMAVEFMEEMWRKQIGANRYNNYLGFQILFFNWLIEHNYSKSNPFKTVKKRKNTEKIRVMEISGEDRKKIRDYLKNHNRRYLAMVLLAYHSLLRPKEIVYLKGINVNIEKQTIIVDGSFSKNHKERIATIPNVLVNLMKEIMIDVGDNDYLFSKTFQKGRILLDRREVSRYWNDLRNTIKLKKEIQFYSLRDSGIIQKLRDGLNPKVVMELADHSSLEVTNKYVKMSAKEANQEAMKKISKF